MLPITNARSLGQ